MNEIITKNAIEICELSTFYGKFRALNGISPTVEDGEFFGFIGPNGAGKSTGRWGSRRLRGTAAEPLELSGRGV